MPKYVLGLRKTISVRHGCSQVLYTVLSDEVRNALVGCEFLGLWSAHYDSVTVLVRKIAYRSAPALRQQRTAPSYIYQARTPRTASLFVQHGLAAISLQQQQYR